MQVLVSVTGLDKAVRQFSKLDRNLGETRAMFVGIAETLEKSNERAWGRGVTLADSTIAEKAQQGLPAEPLVASGDLKASLTKTGAKGAIREIRPTELRFGTSIFYARWQNYGTSHMAAHKVLKFTPTVRKLIKTTISTHLLGK